MLRRLPAMYVLDVLYGISIEKHDPVKYWCCGARYASFCPDDWGLICDLELVFFSRRFLYFSVGKSWRSRGDGRLITAYCGFIWGTNWVSAQPFSYSRNCHTLVYKKRCFFAYYCFVEVDESRVARSEFHSSNDGLSQITASCNRSSLCEVDRLETTSRLRSPVPRWETTLFFRESVVFAVCCLV